MCGLIGVVVKSPNASSMAIKGLYQLVHRGQETVGISASDNGRIYIEKGKGSVAYVFHGVNLKTQLPGRCAIGQTKYTTAGSSDAKDNQQPILRYFRSRPFLLSHNGNVVNVKLDNNERTRSGLSDSVVIADMISASKASSFEEAVVETAAKLKGSFNFLILFNEALYAISDRYNTHPYVIGKGKDGYVVASETSALDIMEASHKHHIGPGEFIKLTAGGCTVDKWTENTKIKSHIFEWVYFSRPDSVIHGIEVGLARRMMGKYSAQLFPIPADLVAPIPRSGNDAAWGYWNERRRSDPELIYDPELIFRSSNIARTFIDPDQEERLKLIDQKFNPRYFLVDGKRIILDDDSLIRANTTRRMYRKFENLKETIVPNMRSIGAKELHLLLASDKYRFPDLYGIDTYREGENLVINKFNGDEKKLARDIGLDSINYLPLEYMIKAILDAQDVAHERYGVKRIYTEDSFYCGPFDGHYHDGTGNYVLT